MNVEQYLKLTKVDGVYDMDPKTNSNAIKYDKVTYDQILQKNLKVMDASAVALARDNKIPIIIFIKKLWKYERSNSRVW